MAEGSKDALQTLFSRQQMAYAPTKSMGITRRYWLLTLVLGLFCHLAGSTSAWAAAAQPQGSLVDYLKQRKDLSKHQRRRLLKQVRVRFGGSALVEETEGRPEIGVAKAILSAAIFMQVKPKQAALGAWEGWRGALGEVPPPIAIHYQILVFEGRRPKGRPIDLAFNFPEYYNEEIAPELVAYWQTALKAGKISDAALKDTKEALEKTQVKMRPLLVDKLRLLARLDRNLRIARGGQRAELQEDIKSVEKELRRAFTRVARRPEVLDKNKRPYDRLRIQLEDMGEPLTADDKLLNPDAPPPPPRPVPKPKEMAEAQVPDDAPALVEPDAPPPLLHLPDQPQPGDPRVFKDPMKKRPLDQLIEAYNLRLQRTVEPWVGTPYRWGNATKGVGTDCSGFTQGVYLEGFAVKLPRVSRDQYRTGFSIARNRLRPGDLVFFDTQDRGRVTHVGIYLGEGKFAHASSSRGVVRDRLKARYYQRAYRGARRVLAYPR